MTILVAVFNINVCRMNSVKTLKHLKNITLNGSDRKLELKIQDS